MTIDTAATVLAIDDEPNNLRALRLDLEDSGYHVLTARDGLEGLEMLRQHREHIKVILLDRMMPNMDGMTFIAEVKSDPQMANIPIVMQTAAAERSQVIEGIKAGVFYYLTKPYDVEVMLSIVSAAVSDYGNHSLLRKEISLIKSKQHLIRDSNFEVRTLEDVRFLSTFLSKFFPDPTRVIFGIHELLVNAVEHGSLGITYEEKSELSKTGGLAAEVQRRQRLPQNSAKTVYVSYVRGQNAITLTIRDEGRGFNWSDYLEISPERATHNHGRGIALSRMMSFDQMEYTGCGNEVICIVHLTDDTVH